MRPSLRVPGLPRQAGGVGVGVEVGVEIWNGVGVEGISVGVGVGWMSEEQAASRKTGRIKTKKGCEGYFQPARIQGINNFPAAMSIISF